jgi:hypothetical protein
MGDDPCFVARVESEVCLDTGVWDPARIVGIVPEVGDVTRNLKSLPGRLFG